MSSVSLSWLLATEELRDVTLAFVGWCPAIGHLRTACPAPLACLPKTAPYNGLCLQLLPVTSMKTCWNLLTFEAMMPLQPHETNASASRGPSEHPPRGMRPYHAPPRGTGSLDAAAFLLTLHDVAIHAYAHLFAQAPSFYVVTRPQCLSLSMGPMVVMPRERLEFYHCFCFSDHVSKVEATVPVELATIGLQSVEINVHHSNYVGSTPKYRYLSVRLVLENDVHVGVSLQQPLDGQMVIVDFYNTTHGWKQVEPWLRQLFLTNINPCILLMSAMMFPRPMEHTFVNESMPSCFLFKKSTPWTTHTCLGTHVLIQSTPLSHEGFA